MIYDWLIVGLGTLVSFLPGSSAGNDSLGGGTSIERSDFEIDGL